MQSEQLDNALWQFANYLYAQPNNAQFLLNLQDQHGLDINLILFMLYLDHRNIRLNQLQLREILQQAQDWQQYIQAMRQLRRNLKSFHNNLYQQAKSFELDIEQHYLHMLFSTSLKLPSDSELCKDTYSNLTLYLNEILDKECATTIAKQWQNAFNKKMNSDIVTLS